MKHFFYLLHETLLLPAAWNTSFTCCMKHFFYLLHGDLLFPAAYTPVFVQPHEMLLSYFSLLKKIFLCLAWNISFNCCMKTFCSLNIASAAWSPTFPCFRNPCVFSNYVKCYFSLLHNIALSAAWNLAFACTILLLLHETLAFPAKQTLQFPAVWNRTLWSYVKPNFFLWYKTLLFPATWTLPLTDAWNIAVPASLNLLFTCCTKRHFPYCTKPCLFPACRKPPFCMW